MAQITTYKTLEGGIKIGVTQFLRTPWYSWLPRWWRRLQREKASWQSIQLQETRRRLGGKWVQYCPPTQEICSNMWFRKEDADKAHVPWSQHVGAFEDWG